MTKRSREPGPFSQEGQSLVRWSDLAAAGEVGVATAFSDQDVIARRDDPATACWYHATGALEVFQPGADGRSYLARLLLAPNIICLKECIAGEQRYLQTVRALERASLMRIERERALALLMANPALSLRTLVEVSRAFCGAAGLEANRLHGTESLLANVVLAYCEACGEPWDGVVRMRVKRTQADLADCIGANERSVNRILTTWKAQGLVDKRDSRLLVLDATRLAERVEDGRRALVHHGDA
ncbi:MAG: Crp/Fnr family transcriptional regulator [Deltaproteobacteria bacterium]|nr:Crp/Fnr family transcriptional regulator [Deltaproteobacteria bacterium]